MLRQATVGEAVDRYQVDLKARGADSRKAAQVGFELTATVAAKPIAMLSSRELGDWRNNLVSKNGLKPASADRVGRSLKAAFALAAADDRRITNHLAWKTGLARLPDAERARQNAILSDETVRAVVAAAYNIEPAFGLLLEVLATSGARCS